MFGRKADIRSSRPRRIAGSTCEGRRSTSIGIEPHATHTNYHTADKSHISIKTMPAYLCNVCIAASPTPLFPPRINPLTLTAGGTATRPRLKAAAARVNILTLCESMMVWMVGRIGWVSLHEDVQVGRRGRAMTLMMSKHYWGAASKPAAPQRTAKAATTQRPLPVPISSIQSWCTHTSSMPPARGLLGTIVCEKESRRSQSRQQSPRCDLSVWLASPSGVRRSPRRVERRRGDRCTSTQAGSDIGSQHAPHTPSTLIDVDPNSLRISFIPLASRHTADPVQTASMKTQVTLAAVAVAALGCAQAFMVGTPLAGAPKSQVCSSTTRMAVALPPLPCKLGIRIVCCSGWSALGFD